MSGHSKWHNIQARKGKQDAKRSKFFSMYAKKIAIAARGGGDPTTNFALRLLIDKAREVGMPKDNIDRAIKRGTGEDKTAAQIEECTYECYGPGGVAIIVKAVTDNKNRVVSDLKHLLNLAGGSMGGAGSVAWMFEQCGMIEISNIKNKMLKMSDDEFDLFLIDAGAEDVARSGDEMFIKTKVGNLQNIASKLKTMRIEPEESGLVFEPKDKVPVAEENRARLENLFSALEENEDIEDFYTNAG